MVYCAERAKKGTNIAKKNVGDARNVWTYAELDDLRHKVSGSEGRMTKLSFEVWNHIRSNYTKL